MPKTVAEQRVTVHGLINRITRQIKPKQFVLVIHHAEFLKRVAWQELISLQETCKIRIILVMAGSPDELDKADLKLIRQNCDTHIVESTHWEAVQLLIQATQG